MALRFRHITNAGLLIQPPVVLTSRRGNRMTIFISRLEVAFYKLLFRGSTFIRHSDVMDTATNPNVGEGNGMARTTSPIFSTWLLRKFSNGKTALDLGCGDGVVLRLMRYAGFKNIFGIEADEQLAALAMHNEPGAVVIVGDMTSSEIVSRIPYREITVFAFNPASPEVLTEGIRKLMESRESLILILRNPKAIENLIQAFPNSKILRDAKRNHAVLQISH